MCEASSFQLEDTIAFAPEVAVLLNLEPDHLDRHGTFEDYVAAKLRIFANQGNDDVAVAPVDLDVEDLGGCARRVPFGSRGAELSDRAGYLWWDDEPLIDVTEISLPGAHNRANAMAAAAACLARGIDRDAVAAGPAHLRRRRAPARADRHPRRGRLRQRLQGDERRQHAGGAAQLRPPAST